MLIYCAREKTEDTTTLQIHSQGFRLKHGVMTICLPFMALPQYVVVLPQFFLTFMSEMSIINIKVRQ